LILLGDACRSDGQSELALRHYRDANWRSQKRLARSPENVELQNDVAAGALRAADLMLDMGDDEEALIAYATARQILTDLLATSPENVALRTHLALTEEKISALKRRGGDLAGAGESLLRARKLIDAILAGDATEAARRHSARIERKYGEYLFDADQPAAARAAFDRAIETLAGLPDERAHCIAHVVCLYNLYVLAREGGDTRSALNYCSRSLRELRELESKKMLEPEHGTWIALLENDQQKLAQLELSTIR
jgi:tetratricopeptide (TPR) repeat protein